jgi:hypothetical protein
MSKINIHINNLMQEFGFKTSTDFLLSTFGFSIKKSVLLMGGFFGFLEVAVKDFIGLDPLVYISFVILLFLEFLTGIKASVKEGKKIQSKRIGRVILKIMIYTLIIGIINIFSTKLFIPKVLGYSLNIYSVIYYSVLNLIIFQLLLSVFENLTRLGYSETNQVFKFLTKKADKWFSLDDDDNKVE